MLENYEKPPNGPTAATQTDSLTISVRHIPSETYTFPLREFGTTKPRKRCCLRAWLVEFPWTHYIESKDVVVCTICCEASNKSECPLLCFN